MRGDGFIIIEGVGKALSQSDETRSRPSSSEPIGAPGVVVLSPRHLELKKAFVEEAQATFGDGHDVARRDREGEFSRSLWRQCAELGILRWAVPVEHGGRGYDVLSTTVLMEALGYACRDNGLTFGLGVQTWGIQKTLLQFGTPAQVRGYLPGLMRGDLLGAYAINEEGSGSDAFGLDTTAAPEGEHFVLNGEKTYITFAPIADFAIVFAKTNPAAGRWGISAFVVDAQTPGFTAHPADSNMGLRTVPVGTLSFDGCRVPKANLLGKVGAGASIFNASQSWERSLVLAPQVGAMERQLEQSVALARSRKRNGIPIGKHQAVAHRIADMKLRLETARMLLYRTAWLRQTEQPHMMDAALTKIHLSEAFAESSRAAIAIHGGEGYTTDAQVERDLRDAIGATIYGGTGDIQRNIVAALLGL